MKAIAIAGLGFGDEGKGTTVDALAEKLSAGLVVRYNGGAQAAHNVVRGDKHHTFSQFGSATLLGVKTHLSRFMVVNPGAFLVEAATLEGKGIGNPHQLVSVSPDALVTTPYHIYANRLREELRGKNAHGTTGMGVGETVTLDKGHPELSMKVLDLFDAQSRRRMLDNIREVYLEEFASGKELTTAIFHDRDSFEHAVERFREFSEKVMVREDEDLGGMMHRAKTTIFEGAQGMLLDQIFGFHPYSTWSDCSFDQVLDLVDDFDVELVRLGVLRSYHTRHGAGPLPTEKDSFHEITYEDHNAKAVGYQGKFRAGPFDLVLAKYGARTVGHLDGLVMTHLDKLPKDDFASYATSYLHPGTERLIRDLVTTNPEEIADNLKDVEPRYANIGSASFPAFMAGELGVPLVMTSSGPTSADKVFLT